MKEFVNRLNELVMDGKFTSSEEITIYNGIFEDNRIKIIISLAEKIKKHYSIEIDHLISLLNLQPDERAIMEAV